MGQLSNLAWDLIKDYNVIPKEVNDRYCVIEQVFWDVFRTKVQNDIGGTAMQDNIQIFNNHIKMGSYYFMAEIISEGFIQLLDAYYRENRELPSTAVVSPRTMAQLTHEVEGMRQYTGNTVAMPITSNNVASLNGVNIEVSPYVENDRMYFTSNNSNPVWTSRNSVTYSGTTPISYGAATANYVPRTELLATIRNPSLGTTNVIEITPEEWAPGIWDGTEGERIDIVRENGQLLTTRTITHIDFQNRIITLNGDPFYVAVGDKLYDTQYDGDSLFGINATDYVNWQSSPVDASGTITISDVQSMYNRVASQNNNTLYNGVNDFGALSELISPRKANSYSFKDLLSSDKFPMTSVGYSKTRYSIVHIEFARIPNKVFTFDTVDNIEFDDNNYPKNALKEVAI